MNVAVNESRDDELVRKLLQRYVFAKLRQQYSGFAKISYDAILYNEHTVIEMRVGRGQRSFPRIGKAMQN